MHFSSMLQYRSASILLTFGLIASLSGCAASRDAGATPSEEVIPPGGRPEASTATTAAGVVAAATSTPTAVVPAAPTETATSTTVATLKDTVVKEPPITVPSVAKRTRKDSIALVSAI